MAERVTLQIYGVSYENRDDSRQAGIYHGLRPQAAGVPGILTRLTPAAWVLELNPKSSWWIDPTTRRVMLTGYDPATGEVLLDVDADDAVSGTAPYFRSVSPAIGYVRHHRIGESTFDINPTTGELEPASA